MIAVTKTRMVIIIIIIIITGTPHTPWMMACAGGERERNTRETCPNCTSSALSWPCHNK